MLADLSAEHFSWAASGDKRNLDATTFQSRGDAFLARIGTLYDDALILTLPGTYTGVTLKFLEKTSYYNIDNSVQTVGIRGIGTRRRAPAPLLMRLWPACGLSWRT